jgi:hypothetical protein
MVTRKNTKNKTTFAYNKVQGLEAFASAPFKGVKSVGKMLSIRSGSKRIDLNGRQINALKSVLAEVTA